MNVPVPGDPLRQAARPPYARLAGLVLVYTLFVLLFGAVVRITHSGAGCGDDWPRCHGEFAHVPQSAPAAIELTHRVTSGLALLAVVGLYIMTIRKSPRAHPARRLADAAVLLMVLEALIGASLVLFRLVETNSSVSRAVVMPAHLVNTYALTAVLTALGLSRDGPLERHEGERSFRGLLLSCAVALVVVSATGAVTALGDTVFPPEGVSLGARIAEDHAGGAHFLKRLRVVHPVLAVLAVGLLVHTARRVAKGSTNARVRHAGRAVVALSVAELALGVLNVVLSAPGWLQVVHLGVALCLWIAFVALAGEHAAAPATRVFRWVRNAAAGLVVAFVAVGAYVYAVLPRPTGSPVVLSAELFKRPAKPLPVQGIYVYRSATELAELIRTGKASSLEVTSEFLANIKNNNHKYAALVWLREAEALADARRADEAVAQGKPLGELHGVPITVKEMFWVQGSPSTLNSKRFGFRAPRDGVLVRALKESGAIVLGTTNVPLLLADYQTSGEVYPTASNPYDTARTPGGSTGGGAAALAAGFSALELGSDFGGSLRVPATFCQLWALKSSSGAVNVSEDVGPETTHGTRAALASAGPMARYPEDLELMWNAVRRAKMDPRFQHAVAWKPASKRELRDYRFAWMDEWPREGGAVKIGEETKTRLGILVESLGNNGSRVERTAPNTYDRMLRLFYASFGAMLGEGKPWLVRKLVEADVAKTSGGLRAFQAFEDAIDDPSDAAWTKLESERAELNGIWRAFFERYDFFVVPVTFGPAFTKRAPGAPIEADGRRLGYLEYFPYAAVFNATGHPCLSVPLGRTREGLPIGVQIVGPLYSEPELLHLAKLLPAVVPSFVMPRL